MCRIRCRLSKWNKNIYIYSFVNGESVFKIKIQVIFQLKRITLNDQICMMYKVCSIRGLKYTGLVTPGSLVLECASRQKRSLSDFPGHPRSSSKSRIVPRTHMIGPFLLNLLQRCKTCRSPQLFVAHHFPWCIKWYNQLHFLSILHIFFNWWHLH